MGKFMSRHVARGLASSAMALAVATGGGIAPATAETPAFRYIPAPPRAPEGAPNVLLVLTDDVGFAASSSFGGPIPTPVLDKLAETGLRYNAFHTTAMCSPTRASLLTGRNHHAVATGSITNVAVDEPGYTSVIPKSAATLGRVLRDNGYDTAWFGKNHNTPEWEVGPLGPFDRWPNGLGFDYFYGFNAAMTDQVNPALTENRTAVRRDPKDPDYFLDRDLADHMINWLRVQDTLHPDRPFFAYLAPGTLHMPQQAPAEWIAKFRGRFDQGWDTMRDEIFARQKKMGIVPANAHMAPRPTDIPAWNSLTPEQKHIQSRLMEVAAAQLAYLDFQIGRVIEQLRVSGRLDNTMVIFVQGDNGSSLEKFNGSVNEYLGFAGVEETDEDLKAKLDVLGGEQTAGQYSAGWAFATNTPFPWGKQIASHLGGLRDGLVISWPKRIHDGGGVRSQFSHVIDIAPTIYEAAGIMPPVEVDGVKQQPIDGISMVYSFDDAKAPTRHREQYFEMLGNRSYYRDGWLAATIPAAPPWTFTLTDPAKFGWELYDLNTDFSQTKNLAKENPAKLGELQQAFDAAAKRNHVYPIVSNMRGRMAPENRPRAIPTTGAHRFYAGDTPYPAYAWPVLNPKWQASAHIALDAEGASGPIISVGTRFSGYRLMLEGGTPTFVYDPTGRPAERITLRAPSGLGVGRHEIKVAFRLAEGKPELGLSVDGRQADSASLPRVINVIGGQAFVGRSMLDDRTGPLQCACGIDEVVISND
ncbi:MAG: sulfatase-like hydrolase/transferase [Sphingobium sp.]